MYELRDPSRAPRLTLAGLAGVSVMLAWWLLLGPGLKIAGTRFGWIGKPGDEIRRICLATGFSIYYIRILFTEFVFLKRGVSGDSQRSPLALICRQCMYIQLPSPLPLPLPPTF